MPPPLWRRRRPRHGRSAPSQGGHSRCADAAPPIDAPCTQRLRHGDPIHARKALTAAEGGRCRRGGTSCCGPPAPPPAYLSSPPRAPTALRGRRRDDGAPSTTAPAEEEEEEEEEEESRGVGRLLVIHVTSNARSHRRIPVQPAPRRKQKDRPGTCRRLGGGGGWAGRAPPPPIDAPCTQCLRHGDPIHARKGLTAAAAAAVPRRWPTCLSRAVVLSLAHGSFAAACVSAKADTTPAPAATAAATPGAPLLSAAPSIRR
jgi:hypothetical protein